MAAVVTVLIFIVSRVFKQDKWLGAIIQLGDVQNREQVHQDIQTEKKEQEKRTSLLDKLPAVTLSERVAFTLGIMNIAVSGYIIGAWPTKFYLFYTPKAVVLITMRWLEFRKRGVSFLRCVLLCFLL